MMLSLGHFVVYRPETWHTGGERQYESVVVFVSVTKTNETMSGSPSDRRPSRAFLHLANGTHSLRSLVSRSTKSASLGLQDI